jgi:Icc-related predicted phosphoesterase
MELATACRGWSAALVLPGTGVTVYGVSFFGVGGGSPPTPFGEWSYDFSEEQAQALLEKCPMNAVLVTHSPPYGVVDIDGGGIHRGSTAIRDAILRTNPKLVICGHIHAGWGKHETLGTTTVINAGPEGINFLLAD